MIRRSLTWGAALCACLALACSGDGGSGGPPANAGTAWSQVVASRGTPTLFEVECVRHAYNATTGVWEPQPGFVRTDLWVYAGTPNQVYTLVNGEVIDVATSQDDVSAYPSPGIDPRIVGCGEELATVETAVGGTPLLTTTGTGTADVLDLGTVQLLVNYYTVNGGASGLMVVYANGRMVGMETL